MLKSEEKFQIYIGQAIKIKRKVLKMSQEELAERSGLHRTYISDVERGIRNMSLATAVRIGSALSTKISELVSEAEQLEGPPERN